MSSSPSPTLHLRCGTDILVKLSRAGIAGEKISYHDPLCEGRLFPLDRRGRGLRARAAYLAARYALPGPQVFGDLARAERWLDRCREYSETVLWFEADLYDQVVLAYLLARLEPASRVTRISLICIGSFPGVPRFVGLGQLDPHQLASLWPRRRVVTRAQFRQARAAWAALTARAPGALVRETRSGRALPFLGAALRRYLAEYPSVRNGLALVEHRALQALRGGPATPAELFLEQQSRERRPFLGDAMFYARLRDLGGGEGRKPAVVARSRRLELTDFGRRLLAGEADWLEESGPPRWLGGVRLTRRTPWRYDSQRRLIVLTH